MNKKAILIRNAAATDFGGGERIPVFLARELKKYNMQAIVFSGSDKLLAFAKAENVPRQKTWWWARQNWSGPRALLFPAYVIWQIILYFYYLGQFVRIKPSVVHIQSKDDFTAATFAARTLGINVFWSDYADLKHIWKNYGVWYKNPVGKLVYLAARGAKHIVVVSQEDKRLVSEHIPNGTIKDKLTVIYNGTFDDFAQTKKRPGLTFVSTSRLVTDKGIKELIIAFGKLRSAHQDVRLSIVGDGPEEKDFKKLAKDIPDITFLGHQAKPLDFVAQSDVFVLPTYHEGFSIALLEACMEGLAIITTRVGGNPEIVENKKNGLLIDAKNTDQLYNAMELLYSNENLRLKLGAGARKKYVDQFNFEQIIQNQLLPLYNGK